MDALADVSEAPREAHFWIASWAIGAALRRNVTYPAGGFDWTPNIYVMLVGEPEVIHKTTTLDAGRRLLSKVPGIMFAPNSGTWQGLIPEFNAAEVKHPVAVGPPILVSPLAAAVGELGTWLDLEQPKFEDFMIDMWDGQVSPTPWKHVTQTHGTKQVWNGVLSLAGCTTPAWTQAHITPTALSGGLMSRFVIFYADAPSQVIPIPKFHKKWNAFKRSDTLRHLGEDLCDIASLRGEVEFAPGVYDKIHVPWYERLKAEAQARTRDAVTRKQTHVMKLSIILAASRGTLEISESLHLQAIATVDALGAGRRRVFEMVAAPRESINAREIVAVVGREWALHARPVAFGELLRLLSSSMTHDEIGLAIRAAVVSGRLRVGPNKGLLPGATEGNQR